MKTNLPSRITTIEEAKKLLADLYHNHEDIHPQDDAHDIPDLDATTAEREHLNNLMCQIYCDIPENKDKTGDDMGFDPCAFLIQLDRETEQRAFPITHSNIAPL